jgi:hypothetical protein
MKICWDNLEKLKYSKKTGKWYMGNTTYVYCESCSVCNEDHISRIFSKYCSISCMNVETKKEIKLSQDHKNKIGLSCKGNKHTNDTKRKISESHMGIHSGDKNPNWKGGISIEPYCVTWLDKEFKEFIFERDNYKCQNPSCWNKSKRLIRHHIDYDKKNCKPDNIITLCNSCNIRANTNREYWKEIYKNIINERGKI